MILRTAIHATTRPGALYAAAWALAVILPEPLRRRAQPTLWRAEMRAKRRQAV